MMAGISSKAAGKGLDCRCGNKKGYNGNEIQGKEFSDGSELDVYDFNARTYDQQIGRFIQIDPMVLSEDFLVEMDEVNGGAFNLNNLQVYAFAYNNPIRYNDPNGKCPNCVTAAVGSGIGALIGGGFELGKQLWRDGKVTSWKAVGGTAVQGAITGGAAGLTGGASLLTTVVVTGTGNVAGGSANRFIQGQETSLKDLALDFSIGAALCGATKLIPTPAGVGSIKGGAWVATKESMSEAAAGYQSLITGQAANKSFLLNGVKFDGLIKNVLVDAKSGYGNFVNKATGQFYSWFKGGTSLVNQAQRQLQAANGTKIQWFFENKAAIEATQKLFKDNGVKGIDLIFRGR